MKKYIYKLTLEDGTVFDYTIDNGIMFNAKDEAGEVKVSLITSAVFVDVIDDEPQVVEAAVVENVDEQAAV